MDAPRPQKMSCKEAAEYLSVTEKVLARWRLDRRGPVFFRPQIGRPFYLRSDLDDWLRASRVETFGVTTQNDRKRPRAIGEAPSITYPEDEP